MDSNIDVVTFESPLGRGIVRADVQALRDILDAPEALLDSASILKDSRSTKAGIAFWPGAEERPKLFVKRHNIKGALHAAKYAVRKPRAFREFRASARLEALGLPVPRPLAALATRNGMFAPGPSYFIAETVEGAVSTLKFLIQAFSDEKVLQNYIDAVLGALGAMHNAGISHGDTKCSNFFAVKRADGGFEFGLWDLLSCRFHNLALGEKKRFEDVDRFAASLAEIAERLEMPLPKSASWEEIRKAYAR